MSDFPTEAESTWGTAGEGEQQPAADTQQPEVDQETMIKRAREQGWTETTAFDYEAFTRQGGANADWYAAAGVYEWQDEYGEVGPEVPDLERLLFGRELRQDEGRYRDEFERMEIAIEGPEKIAPISTVTPTTKLTNKSTASLTSITVRQCRPASSHAAQRPPLWLRDTDSHSSLHHPCRPTRLRRRWHCSDW